MNYDIYEIKNITWRKSIYILRKNKYLAVAMEYYRLDISGE